MDIKFDTSGFDELKKAARKLDGQHDVPITELMPPEFIRRHTKCADVEAFLGAAGVNKPEDLASGAIDSYVAEHAPGFKSWEEMCEAALVAYAQKKLGL